MRFLTFTSFPRQLHLFFAFWGSGPRSRHKKKSYVFRIPGHIICMFLQKPWFPASQNRQSLQNASISDLFEALCNTDVLPVSAIQRFATDDGAVSPGSATLALTSCSLIAKPSSSAWFWLQEDRRKFASEGTQTLAAVAFF